MSYTYTDELYHFGVKGMKWGVRRYQNADGSLTPEGRRHYGVAGSRLKEARNKRNVALKNAHAKFKTDIRRINDETERRYKKVEKNYKRFENLSDKDVEREARIDEWADREGLKAVSSYDNSRKRAKAQYKATVKKIKSSPEYKEERNAKIKKALIGAAVVGGVALAAYGGYKAYQATKDYRSRVDLGKSLMAEANKHMNLYDENVRLGTKALRTSERYLSEGMGSNAAEYAKRGNIFFDAAKANQQNITDNLTAYTNNLNELSKNPIYKAKVGADALGVHAKRATADTIMGTRKAYDAASRGARSAYDTASRGARSVYDRAERTMRNVRDNNPIARAQANARRDRTVAGVMSANDARRAHSGLSRAKADLEDARNVAIRRRRRRAG